MILSNITNSNKLGLALGIYDINVIHNNKLKN